MIPYERIVQWAAGPVSALIAYGATKLVHATISHDQALNVATFGLTALAGVAGHWKWLTNAAKWWEHVGAPAAPIEEPTGEEPPLESHARPDGPSVNVTSA